MSRIGIAISGGPNPAEMIGLVVLAESLGYGRPGCEAQQDDREECVGIEVVGGEGDRRAREVEEELGRAPILPS